MGMRIVRHRDLVLTPWKNGGGTTAEVAVDPPGARLDGFEWRISMADVAAAGPFSTFPGVDRTLVLIEGEALDVEVAGITHRLDATVPALTFPGEARTTASLPSGPIRDFNVMTRRGRFSHQVRVAVEEHAGAGTTLVLMALQDGTSARVDGGWCQLERFDVLVLDPWPGDAVSSRPMISVGLTRL